MRSRYSDMFVSMGWVNQLDDLRFVKTFMMASALPISNFVPPPPPPPPLVLWLLLVLLVLLLPLGFLEAMLRVSLGAEATEDGDLLLTAFAGMTVSDTAVAINFCILF